MSITKTYKFAAELEAAIETRARVIAESKEALLEAWIAQHGWNPDECQLVSQDLSMGFELKSRTWVEKRGEFEELRRYREREPMVQTLVKCAVLDGKIPLERAASFAIKVTP